VKEGERKTAGGKKSRKEKAYFYGQRGKFEGVVGEGGTNCGGEGGRRGYLEESGKENKGRFMGVEKQQEVPLPRETDEPGIRK